MYAEPTYIAPATYVAPVPTYVPSYEVGRSSNFKKLNCCALLSALVLFGVLIAAATVCWFQYQEIYQAVSTDSTGATVTSTINSTTSCYDLQGVTTTTKGNSVNQAALFTPYDSSTAVWSTMKLCQSFVLIGLILSGILAIFLVICFADSVRNRLLFAAGMNVLRVVLLAIALLILVSMIIAFLGFLGITNAFSSDIPNCNKGYCRRFADNTKADLGPNTVTIAGVTQTNVDVTDSVVYGPNAGWYLVLGCIPVAILLCILVVLNKFPIPVDSVGSGEAL